MDKFLLQVPVNQFKVVAAVAAQWLGRGKLNGSLSGYSPLSRFIELEILTMGIDRKTQLWHTLADLADLRRRIPNVDFDHLVRHAEQQRDELEPHRHRAGLAALGTPQHRPISSRSSNTTR